MAKFLLHYTSGVKSEIVEAAEGIEAYIAARFGHKNEYLKLGGAAPKLIEEVSPVVEEPQPEVVANEGSSSGSTEPVAEPTPAASTDEHGASEAGPV